MTMMRQSSSRNQRSGGWYVKHVLQICLLIAVCVWLLYQVKHSHDKRKALEYNNLHIIDIIEESKPDFLKFGRKDPLQDTLEIALDITTHSGEEGNEEAVEAAEQENKKEENGDEEGKRAGDDSIEENDQDSADEDGEDGDEFVDEEVKGAQLEDLSSSDKQDHERGVENTQAAPEEHYKADDASSAVVKDAQEMGKEDGNFSMGNLDEEQMRPGKEELGDDGRTDVIGNVPKDDELHDVPTDSESQMHNTSMNNTAVVERETEVGTLPNSTMLLEFGGQLGEHDITTSESNDHMEQQNNSTPDEPSDQIEQHNSFMQAASDEQMQTKDLSRGDIAEIGDSSHENETVNWNKAQEQNIVDEIQNPTEDNSRLEDIPSEQAKKSNMDGGSDEMDESQTTSSVADQNDGAVQEEATNASNGAVAVTEEE